MKHLSNCENLHTDYENWATFLQTCDLVEEYKGWKFYNASNCYYIVNPYGRIFDNLFGSHGWHIWITQVKDIV